MLTKTVHAKIVSKETGLSWDCGHVEMLYVGFDKIKVYDFDSDDKPVSFEIDTRGHPVTIEINQNNE